MTLYIILKKDSITLRCLFCTVFQKEITKKHIAALKATGSDGIIMTEKLYLLLENTMHTLTILDGTKKYNVTFDGTPTVQQVLETNGITMPHPCGGAGRCGKCEIEIIGYISRPDEKELSFDCRLSCRTRLYGDATVVLHTDTNLLAETTIENIAVSSGEPGQIGAAVDIGTTTVALSVYDLTTGALLAAETMLNPQSTVAADVIGRIDAASKGRLSELQGMIHSCVQTLAKRTGYIQRIDKWCITGNTTMLYLFQGLNP